MIRSAYGWCGRIRQQAEKNETLDNLSWANRNLTPIVPTDQTVFDSCEWFRKMDCRAGWLLVDTTTVPRKAAARHQRQKPVHLIRFGWIEGISELQHADWLSPEARNERSDTTIDGRLCRNNIVMFHCFIQLVSATTLFGYFVTVTVYSVIRYRSTRLFYI